LQNVGCLRIRRRSDSDALCLSPAHSSCHYRIGRLSLGFADLKLPPLSSGAVDLRLGCAVTRVIIGAKVMHVGPQNSRIASVHAKIERA
jgi:hypothetical protein